MLLLEDMYIIIFMLLLEVHYYIYVVIIRRYVHYYTCIYVIIRRYVHYYIFQKRKSLLIQNKLFPKMNIRQYMLVNERNQQCMVLEYCSRKTRSVEHMNSLTTPIVLKSKSGTLDSTISIS